MKHEVLAQEDAATAAAGFWMGFWPGLNRALTQSRARRQCQVHRGGDDFKSPHITFALTLSLSFFCPQKSALSPDPTYILRLTLFGTPVFCSAQLEVLVFGLSEK